MAHKKNARALGVKVRQELVDLKDSPLSIKRQCELLDIKRGRVYYKPQAKSSLTIEQMNAYLEIYGIDPCIGSRRITKLIEERTGKPIGRKKATKIRKTLGLKTLYPHRDTSKPSPQHKKYPYLLKNMTINRPDQVWTSDITYLPVGKGHFYLCCVMDWASREILGYSLSNTMDATLCLNALEQALNTGRCPTVFNTDQGSQYTSEEWLKALEIKGITVSMDGRGRWQDNVRMERFWRSFKYEHYFIHGHETLNAIREASRDWIEYYNTRRPHSKLKNLPPSVWSAWEQNAEEAPPQANFFQAASTPLRSVTAA